MLHASACTLLLRTQKNVEKQGGISTSAVDSDTGILQAWRCKWHTDPHPHPTLNPYSINHTLTPTPTSTPMLARMYSTHTCTHANPYPHKRPHPHPHPHTKHPHNHTQSHAHTPAHSTEAPPLFFFERAPHRKTRLSLLTDTRAEQVGQAVTRRQHSSHSRWPQVRSMLFCLSRQICVCVCVWVGVCGCVWV